MKTKEIEEKLVRILKGWQKIEDEAVISTDEIIAASGNSITRSIFEIIHHDAQNHRRVQEVIIRGHEKAGFVMTVEQLEELAKVISRHMEVEKRMREAAEEALGLIQGKNMVLHEYFLNYLLEDEKKHMDMLKGIEDLKRAIHPYGPAA